MFDVRSDSSVARAFTSLVLAFALLAGCSQSLTVGEWVCAEDGVQNLSDAGAVALPWSTSFETRFCEYSQPVGFCYADDDAAYTIVTDPVHSGRHAASFHVRSGTAAAGQTRCVRQGVLPTAAYYGAWYLIPAPASNAGLWNLWHFRGGDASSNHGLWDVSLVDGPSGTLQLIVYDFVNARTRRATTPKAVPIGRWFHIELYLKRANDLTGEVALYQDGEPLIAARQLRTDDSSWGQWYVGNLADSLTPADSTLYVDDVTIRSSR